MAFIVIALFLAADGLPPGFGTIDLVQYWSASRAALEGSNPYDAATLWRFQQPELPELTGPVMMWNPPILLPFVVWSGFLPFSQFAVIWFALSAAVFGSSILCLLRYVFPPADGRAGTILRVGAICTFFPCALSISYGQLGPLLLLGWLGFLLFARTKAGVADTFTGGSLLAITLVKPHLLFLVYFWLGLSSVVTRKRGTVAGITFVFLVLIGIVFLVQPELSNWYFNAARQPPIYFKTPTMGSWFQEWLGRSAYTARMLPTIIVLAVVSVLFFVQRLRGLELTTVLILAPWSLLCSPYGWVYDQVLLLPTVIWIATSGRRTAPPIVLILANITLAVTPADWGQQWGVWYPLVVALLASDKGLREIPAANPCVSPAT